MDLIKQNTNYKQGDDDPTKQKYVYEFDNMDYYTLNNEKKYINTIIICDTNVHIHQPNFLKDMLNIFESWREYSSINKFIIIIYYLANIVKYIVQLLCQKWFMMNWIIELL